MPDSEGKLTQNEKELAKKWLADHKAVQPCPVCGHQNWTLADEIAHVPLYSPGAMLAGSGYPVVTVVCVRCTFFRFHSAVIMGLVPGAEQVQSAEQTTEVKHG